LIERLQAQEGVDVPALAEALQRPAPVDLRVNINQTKREAVLRAMQAQGWDVSPTPYSPWGIRMAQRRSLTSTEWFERGDIEVQDEGSQLLAWLVGAKRSEVIADFCAGAGGKTLAMGAMMRGQGRVYAMDTSAHRLEALRPRMLRSGLQEIYSLAIADEKDARLKPLHHKMNRVLVDAPCSGLGTVRRSPEIKWRTQPQDIEQLSIQQASILESAAKLVRDGGRLVYATCSLLKAESERVAEAFGATHKDFVALPMSDLLKPLVKDDLHRASMISEGGLRLWPHLHGTDGFYAAVWERRR
jgi:16S rRNA (cytosine967-C5)-methyltransferase